ncbi:MAG: hypothetical protein AAF802_19520 [Planctomycetota bacterium]
MGPFMGNDYSSRQIALPFFALLVFVLCWGSTHAEEGTNRGQPRVEWSIFDVRDDESNPVSLSNVYGIEVTEDAIFFSTVGDHSIWRSRLDGRGIKRYAGTGDPGFSGDGGPAIDAAFNAPHEIRSDSSGNLFIADTRNHCIRRIDSQTKHVETLAGDGVAGFQGDRGAARFDQPHSLVLDGRGGILIADTKNHRLRRLELETNTIATIGGTGEKRLPEEGQNLTDAALFGPRSLAVHEDTTWLVLREGNSVWRLSGEERNWFRAAGTGRKGYSGDGEAATLATFRGPKGIDLDAKSNIYIVDTENHAIRAIDSNTGKIWTLRCPFKLKRPHGVAVLREDQDSGSTSILISDSENDRVLSGRVWFDR